jgi:hypothetical protein
MDGCGNIAVGYTVSSEVTAPSLRYTGRLASDPPGEMRDEEELAMGLGTQHLQRWGDYFAMTVDEADQCTF